MVADRNRHKASSDMDWQATEKFSLQGNGEFTDDDYLNSTYGLKKRRVLGGERGRQLRGEREPGRRYFLYLRQPALLSGGDAYGSNSTASTVGQAGNTAVSGGCFATVAAKNASAKIDPCLNWSKNNRDKDDTVGFVAAGERTCLRGSLNWRPR